MNWLKRLGLVITIVTAILGIAASACQFSKACSAMAGGFLRPIWEDVEPVIYGEDAVASKVSEFTANFDAGLRAQQANDFETACKSYRSANGKLDDLNDINAKVNVNACRCSVALHVLEICQTLGTDENDRRISQECRCDRKVPVETDCSSSCRQSMDSYKEIQ